jgi:hypothetical protein
LLTLSSLLSFHPQNTHETTPKKLKKGPPGPNDLTAERSSGLGLADITAGQCEAVAGSGAGSVLCEIDKTDPNNPIMFLEYVCPSGTTALQTSCPEPRASPSQATIAAASLLAFVQDGQVAQCTWVLPSTTTDAIGTIAAICTDLTLNIALMRKEAQQGGPPNNGGGGGGAGKGAPATTVVRQTSPEMPAAGSRAAMRAWIAQVLAGRLAAGGPDRARPGKQPQLQLMQQQGARLAGKAAAATAAAAAAAKSAAPAATATTMAARDPLAGARLAGPRAVVVTSSESMRP